MLNAGYTSGMANRKQDTPRVGRPPKGERKDSFIMLRTAACEKEWANDWAVRLGYRTTADFLWAAMESLVRTGRPSA